MRRLSLLLCLLWMGFIFYNSSQTGEESNDKTIAIVENIANKSDNVSKPEINNKENESTNNVTNESNNKKNNEDTIIKKLNLFLRKSAHAFEFLILAILVAWVCFTFGLKGKHVIVYTLFAVLLYAVSDEFHQLFVPGRTGRVEDILIDFSGGIVGIGIFYIIYYIKNSRRIIK